MHWVMEWNSMKLRGYRGQTMIYLVGLIIQFGLDPKDRHKALASFK